MNNLAKFIRLSGALLVAFAACCSGLAFKFILNNRTGLPIKWPAGTIPITIMLGTKDGTDFNPVAKEAADIWNARLGSAQFSSTLAAAGAPSNTGNVNELGFANDVFGKAFEPSVLAVTTSSSSGNDRVSSDILFNAARTWSSYRGALQSNIDLRRVAIHELGHVLGLDHPDEDTPAQIVPAVMNSHISSIDTLVDDDITGGQALYGPPGVPANNNFANATDIAAFTGNLTLTGYNTNATKEAGEPNHANNAGGRSVWWRWRPGASGPATIDTRGSYYDTTLAIYTGTALSSLTAIASSDDINDGVVQASSVSFNVVGGTTYQIAVDGFNGDASGADNAGIKLNLSYTAVSGTPPAIVTQPSPASVTAGGSVTFSVSATGTDPLSYQWFFNGTAISGATSASFSIASVQAGNDGTYSVTVTNSAGSATSNGVALTVRSATPTPTPTPPSSGGGGGGGAPSFWFVGMLAALGLGRLRSRRHC